ncbi:MAG: Rrf2 family transcriptional regulator [Selenomonadaceae bacterium]|nr:Rrf2 family transcriptional regulator [Selenomonadaceae bacterium]
MISTKGRYALRVMLDLAEQNSEKFIPLEEIANRQDISKKYLEAVLKILVKNNLLEILRGRKGGYKLTRKPAEYFVGEILKLTDAENLLAVNCLKKDCEPCERKNLCKTLPMWKKFDEITNEFFFGITLEDLLNQTETLK